MADWNKEGEVVNKPLLKSREAAEYLSISERTLFQMTKDGKIPCVRMSRGLKRYSREALHRWIQQQQWIHQQQVKGVQG